MKITVHHNRLVLEQWAKRWIPPHLLNYKMKTAKYYVWETKKAFDKVQSVA